MGVFRELGRRVEQFKTDAEAAADETADFRCEECDARFDDRRERCPECGAERVVAVE